MNARSFLVAGLVAGVLAGLATFFVAHQVGEPSVDAAIAVEDSHAAHDPAAAGAVGHQHADPGGGQGTVVSRHNQSTWGLLTGTMAMSIALGGIIALASAGVVGRIGRLRPTQSTALVAVIGFFAVALVPFLKYPGTPPAVGNPDTIGHRTAVFFTYLAISVVTAALCTALAARLLAGLGTYRTLLITVGTYLVVVVAAGELMPTVNEIGTFPADTLWTFRRASLTTLATMWAAIGVVLVGLIGRQHEQSAVTNARRELAASL